LRELRNGDAQHVDSVAGMEGTRAGGGGRKGWWGKPHAVLFLSFGNIQASVGKRDQAMNSSLRSLLDIFSEDDDGGHGLFATGPQALIEAYAAVLSKNGIKVSSPRSRPAVWWKDGRWVEEKGPLFALIFGESYFVAAQFAAERTE